MKVLTKAPAPTTTKVTFELEVTGTVLFTDAGAHVLDVFVKPCKAEYLSLSRFSQEDQLRVMEALAAKAKADTDAYALERPL